jgi:ABC-type uncharacterized transport system fused permease/ATPase subunit
VLTKPLFEIATFSFKIYALVGLKAAQMFCSYVLAGGALIAIVMPNFKALISKERALRADYSFVHSRLAAHAESVAFFGGDAAEQTLVEARFGSLLRAAWQRLNTNWRFGLFNQAIVRESPMLIQYILRNEYGRKASDISVTKDSGKKLNEDQLFLFNATSHVFEQLGELLSFGEKFARLSGLVVRVAELDEALEACPAPRSASPHFLSETAKQTPETGAYAAQTLRVEELDLITPAGLKLASRVAVTITKAKPLMITGPNASGKTTFFRVLGGLWPANASANLPSLQGQGAGGSLQGLFLVPQRVYMVPGSLADQVSYPTRLPHAPERASGDILRLQEALGRVGVLYLVERSGGWDATRKWEDLLSLGEQQRIGLARLFFHKPAFAVLDECTSAVSVDVETQLYAQAHELGICCVTISQRLALPEFHKQELCLGRADVPEKWILRDV